MNKCISDFPNVAIKTKDIRKVKKDFIIIINKHIFNPFNFENKVTNVNLLIQVLSKMLALNYLNFRLSPGGSQNLEFIFHLVKLAVFKNKNVILKKF